MRLLRWIAIVSPLNSTADRTSLHCLRTSDDLILINACFPFVAPGAFCAGVRSDSSRMTGERTERQAATLPGKKRGIPYAARV